MKKIFLAIAFAALPITAKAGEIDCMAQAIYYEANGEVTLGKQAVAHVILNRVKSKRFPNTVCGVVYQRGQFSWYKGGTNYKTNEISRKVAKDALNGVSSDPTGGSLYFWATRIGTPKHAIGRFKTRIGGHSFAK